MLVIIKIEPCGEIFLLIDSNVGHHTSREEIEDITLEHMTHINPPRY